LSFAGGLSGMVPKKPVRMFRFPGPGREEGRKGRPGWS